MITNVSEGTSQVEQRKAQILAGRPVSEEEMREAIAADNARSIISEAMAERHAREAAAENHAECVQRARAIGAEVMQIEADAEAELARISEVYKSAGSDLYKALLRRSTCLASAENKVRNLERFSLSPSSAGIFRNSDASIDIGDAVLMTRGEAWEDVMARFNEGARRECLRFDHDLRENKTTVEEVLSA
jgi:hypothetical protein